MKPGEEPFELTAGNRKTDELTEPVVVTCVTCHMILPTLTRYISGLVTLHRYCLEVAALGVVTAGALVRLMAVI